MGAHGRCQSTRTQGAPLGRVVYQPAGHHGGQVVQPCCCCVEKELLLMVHGAYCRGACCAQQCVVPGATACLLQGALVVCAAVWMVGQLLPQLQIPSSPPGTLLYQPHLLLEVGSLSSLGTFWGFGASKPPFTMRLPGHTALRSKACAICIVVMQARPASNNKLRCMAACAGNCGNAWRAGVVGGRSNSAIMLIAFSTKTAPLRLLYAAIA